MKLIVPLSLAVLLILLSPAKAALLEYTNEADFESALGSYSIVDFENLGASSASSKYVVEQGAFAEGPLTVSQTGTTDYIVYKDGFGSDNDGTSYVATDSGTKPQIFSLPTGYSDALGLNVINDGYVPTFSFTVTTSDGTTPTVNYDPNAAPNSPYTIAANEADGTSDNLTFVGFIDTTPGQSITGIDFTNRGGDYDNVVFAPEPSTYVLLGAGMVGLVVATRLRRAAIV